MLARNLFTQHYILINVPPAPPLLAIGEGRRRADVFQQKMGLRFKTAFVSAVFRKALVISPAARAKSPSLCRVAKGWRQNGR